MPENINKSSQANQYDKLFRENMRENLPGIVEHVLRLDLTTVEELRDDVQYTKERETDLLKKVKDLNGNIYILHVEFQSKNDKANMVYRMAEYSVMLQRKYRMPVHQYVIYIGKGKATMVTDIATKNFQFRYNLAALSSIDHNLFLKSDKIEEKMLAILADPGQQKPKSLLKHILLDIKNCAPDELTEDRYIRQLHIFVQLRNLEHALKEIMALTGRIFKIEKDPFYIEGKEKATELERARALEEKKQIARNLRNKGIDLNIIADATGLSSQEIAAL